MKRQDSVGLAAAVLVAAVALATAVGCGGAGKSGSDTSGSGGVLRVNGSVQTLRSLLRAHGVRVDGSAGSVRSAWAAFKEFAAVPIAEDEVIGEAEGDGFLLQWGTYERTFGKHERTFQVEFTRQYVLRNDDLQQVHLVVNFAQAPIDVAPGNGTWSFDLPGDHSSQLSAWIDEVEASRLFAAITASHVEPLAYDVWQDSAE